VLTCDPRLGRELTQELRISFPGFALEMLAPGVFLASGCTASAKLLNATREKRPVFVRHLFPVYRTIALENSAFDPLAMGEECSSLLSHLSPSPIAVQCRIVDAAAPYRAVDIKAAVDAVLERLGHLPETKHPLGIISVVIVKSRAYIGVSTPEQNLSRWNGGAAHYGGAQNALSRAEHKIEEAFEVFGVKQSPGGQALDLGAAPGGWTSFLLKQGYFVTAVDPGALDASLTCHPRLSYLQKNAWQLNVREEFFDLFTCDMGRSALRTVEVLLRLAPSLKEGGQLLMTVKFMGEKPLPLLSECRRRLEPSFSYISGRHLWHNREEVTFYLVKR